MRALRSLVAPFGEARSYRGLAFLLSALPLAGVWLGLLIAVWTVSLALAITPLVVPALIGTSVAVQGAAVVEAALARSLLGVGVRPPVELVGEGFWRRASAVLADRAMWRAQAYLLLRITVGFALGAALLALIALALSLIAAPSFYWSIHAGLGPGWYAVRSLPEALSLVPLGLLALLASVHLIAPLAAPWRSLSGALLDRASAPSPPRAPLPNRRSEPSAQSHARRAVLVHAASSGGLNLLLIVIWALTSRGYFWPMWTLLVLALPLALHAWVVAVEEHRAFWLKRRLDAGFAIHAGVWVALLLFLTGVWAASGGGYFWPVWPLLVAILALGPHAAALLLRSPDRAALRERISTLETSRAGAVDVQESELRRIERDLHDGAQARLVALGMSLGMAEQKLDAEQDPAAARELLAEARAGAGEALRELRDLARGIHPPVLADRGLEAALQALAAVSPISVTVSVTLPARPKPPVESAAYFVVAEAMANAGKHAQASRVDVRVARHGDALSVEAHDDGVGGADPSGGGLGGLRRRVQALDGTLSVLSPPGGPTTIRAELPCEW